MRKTLQNIIFSLIPLFILLGLIEGAARIVGRPVQKSPDAALLNIYSTQTVAKLTGGERDTSVSQLNSLGFRGREFDFHKTDSDYVMLVLGGSVATGAWAAGYANVPSVALEQHLQPLIRQLYNKRLRVYSLAESGNDIEDEAFWLFKLGAHLQPDAVVSITGFNNMFNGLNPVWQLSSGGHGFKRMSIEYQKVDNMGVQVHAHQLAQAIYLFIKKYSVAIQWADHIAFAPKEEKKSENKRGDEDKIANHLKYLDGIKKADTLPLLPAERFRTGTDNLARFCYAKGIRYFVVLQPFRDCGASQMATLAPDGTADNREQQLYRALQQVWTKRGQPDYPVYDASLQLSDTLQTMNAFGDNCHLWDNGFALFNSRIAAWLTQELSAAQKTEAAK